MKKNTMKKNKYNKKNSKKKVYKKMILKTRKGKGKKPMSPGSMFHNKMAENVFRNRHPNEYKSYLREKAIKKSLSVNNANNLIPLPSSIKKKSKRKKLFNNNNNSFNSLNRIKQKNKLSSNKLSSNKLSNVLFKGEYNKKFESNKKNLEILLRDILNINIFIRIPILVLFSTTTEFETKIISDENNLTITLTIDLNKILYKISINIPINKISLDTTDLDARININGKETTEIFKDVKYNKEEKSVNGKYNYNGRIINFEIIIDTFGKIQNFLLSYERRNFIL